MIKNLLKRIPFLYKSIVNLRNSFIKGNLRRGLHFFINGHLVKKIKIYNFLQTKNEFLQIGGGCHTIDDGGWFNADIVAGDIYLNATKPLPFPSDSIDVIFTEQFIEHLPQKDAISFINECYRVLKSGGVIRQSTPNLDKIVSIYNGINTTVDIKAVMKRHVKNHRSMDSYILHNECQFFNDIFRLWGHQFIYDQETLIKIHQNSGFKNITIQNFGISNHAVLNNLERHADIEWMKDGFSLIIEGKK